MTDAPDIIGKARAFLAADRKLSFSETLELAEAFVIAWETLEKMRYDSVSHKALARIRSLPSV